MRTLHGRLLSLLSLSLLCLSEAGAQAGKVPQGVLLVKGAWPSASDSVTPVPEGGKIARNAYENAYFGLRYPLRTEWTQTYDAPPPSDSGYYVLAQIGPTDTSNTSERGRLLIAARDLFFTPAPARNALELMTQTKSHLGADYAVERPPAEVRIAGHAFVELGYVSPVASLHWYVLATQIRCHVVEFVFTSSDRQWIAAAVKAMNAVTLPTETELASGSSDGGAPVCVKDYAEGGNLMKRVDAVLSERRYNSIPVRVIIDRQGKVKHIHFLSAFPAQAKGLTDALMQWQFKPYVRGGQPVEVETGIVFGHARRALTQAAKPD